MTPEYVTQAQDSILGTLVFHYTPQSVVIIQAQGVQPRDFGTPQNRAHILYRAILALHRDGQQIDRITLEGFLSRHGYLERVDGRAYLDLLHVSSVPASLREHAFLVAESGRWERYVRACEAALDAAFARDAERFWEAIGRVRADVVPEPLRVIEGRKEAA